VVRRRSSHGALVGELGATIAVSGSKRQAATDISLEPII